MRRDHWLLFDNSPLAIELDAQEQPEDKEWKATPSVDKIQPTFGDRFSAGPDHLESGQIFEISVEVASAMAFTTDSRPVNLQARLG
jgi:hypothetical protein